MTNQPNIRLASALLWSPIPEGARPRPKPAKVWKTLDLGRELRLENDWHSGLRFFPSGTLFRVEEINSLGVILLEQGPGECASISWRTEWKGTFTKVRRPAKRKAAGKKAAAKRKTEDKP